MNREFSFVPSCRVRNRVQAGAQDMQVFDPPPAHPARRSLRKS
jgi:hypothetical protein